MPIRKVAFLGCGDAGSAFVAGFSSRLPEHYSLRVHVVNVEGRVRARDRVMKLCGPTFQPRASTEFTADTRLDPDTDVLFVQLPRSPAGVNYRELEERGVRPEHHVIECSLAGVKPDCLVLKYTAAFTETSLPPESHAHGLFHFSNPANLLGLVEVGLSGAGRGRRDDMKTLLQDAGYFPLVQCEWMPGFFSIRFQLSLLAAVEAIRKTSTIPHEQLSERIDLGIRMVVSSLLDDYRRGEVCDLAPLQTGGIAGRLLDKFPDFQPLWEAFARTWFEFREVLSAHEIATALLGGPALRCINPGFLRTVDIEGIPAFVGLMASIFPEVSLDTIEGLISSGRIGGAGMGENVPNGFYRWTSGLRCKYLRERDEFLAANSISLATC